MKRYPATLNKSDADLLISVIGDNWPAYPDSRFEWVYEYGQKLKCEIAPNDLRIFIRLLLETEREDAEELVWAIASTLGIEEIWLNVNDFFYITIYEEDELFKNGWEHTATVLDLPYVSVFDEAFWPTLFEELSDE